MRLVMISFLICMLVSLTLSAEVTNEKPRIAVMDLEAKGLSQAEADAVADFLITDLVNTGSFIVIERSRIKDIIKEQQLSLTGLTETKEAAKIGQILNCKLIVVGTLSKLGTEYYLNIRVVDVESGKTTLAKREKSNKLEELSEVSKNVANQLAGKKYLKEGEIEEFKSPPIGIDFQIGFPVSFTFGIVDTRIEDMNFVSPLSNDKKTTRKNDLTASPSFSDIRIGGYISSLYIGYMKRSYLIGKTDEVESTQTIGDANPVTGKYNMGIDYKLTFSDLVIGARSWTKGNIDPKMFYFSWRTITETTTIEEKYSGPCLGTLNKWSYSLGGAPIELIIDFGLYGAYMSYKKPADFKGDKYGISFGGEIGAGMQLKKIGLYFIVAYLGDCFYVKYSNNEEIKTADYTTSIEQTTYYILHGIQIRLGYTFDVQALFH